MAHWIVLWPSGPFAREVPELDVLDLEGTRGTPIATHPGYVSAPKALPLREAPSSPLFRPRGYPWVVLATDEGRAMIEGERGIKLRKPTGLRDGTLPLHCLDPWALHARVEKHNWDDGHALLERALASPTCDKATALYIYWLGGAGWYRQYATRDEVPSHEREGWDLVHAAQRRVLSGGMVEGFVHFDPSDHPERRYEDRAHLFQRELPAAMYEATGRRPSRGLPPLHDAAWDGAVGEIERLLAQGADVNEIARGETPLAIALRLERTAVAALLVRHGAQVSRWDAAAMFRLRAIELADIAHAHGDPLMLLTIAARLGWIEGAERLTGAGDDAMKRALVEAASEGRTAMCAWLLERGAPDDGTALARAAQRHHVETCRLFLERASGAGADAVLGWSLWYSMPGDDWHSELMELALEHGASMERALQLACKHAYGAAFDRLIARGPDVNAVDRFGNGALHYATASAYTRASPMERAQIIRALVASGADVHARDAKGRTPLELATQAGLVRSFRDLDDLLRAR